jgi:DNA-directed RNA polymerase
MRIHGDTQLRKVTSVVNKLQGVPFEINTSFLLKLIEDWDHFIKYGLVLPMILCTIDRNEAKLRLNQHYNNDPEIKKEFKFWPLYKLLLKNITEANYQQNIIYLADAYKDYYMYFPCFMDFRGRNYRYGPFHFHERDLVRSLIVFGDPGQIPETDEDNSRIIKNHALATIFHWGKGYYNYNNAISCYTNYVSSTNIFSIDNSNEISMEEKYQIIYKNAYSARHPFQFIAFMHMALSIESKDSTERGLGWYWALRAPHQLDASASAFQLSSYFLVDLKMARETNLFVDNHQEDQIRDIYKYMDVRIKDFINKQVYKPQPPAEKNVDMGLIRIMVNDTFGRPVVKTLFMPMVYGKSKYSIYNDIFALLGGETTRANVKKIMNLCFDYWAYDFYGLNKLMLLVASTCWVASAIQQPVILSNKYWLTYQDYFVKDKVRVTLRYKPNTPRAKTKRAVVTLRLDTNIRNTRKTANSTFANFIHQKDALTVINFVQMMMHLKDNPGFNNIDFNKAPIYTVHDNFVTTAFYANYLPYIYRRAVSHLGHPLTIINKLIYDNIITATPTVGAPPTIMVELEAVKTNYSIEDPRDCTPISEDTLHYCLIQLYNKGKDGSENVKSFNKTGWEKKIKEIEACYGYLVQTLSSPAGEKRWQSLTACLNRHYDHTRDEYCIHL